MNKKFPKNRKITQHFPKFLKSDRKIRFCPKKDDWKMDWNIGLKNGLKYAVLSIFYSVWREKVTKLYDWKMDWKMTISIEKWIVEKSSKIQMIFPKSLQNFYHFPKFGAGGSNIWKTKVQHWKASLVLDGNRSFWDRNLLFWIDIAWVRLKSLEVGLKSLDVDWICLFMYGNRMVWIGIREM